MNNLTAHARKKKKKNCRLHFAIGVVLGPVECARREGPTREMRINLPEEFDAVPRIRRDGLGYRLFAGFSFLEWGPLGNGEHLFARWMYTARQSK